MFAELSPPYSTIVADPPWEPTLGASWETRFSDKARPQAHYEVMPLSSICALPVPDLVGPQAHLWLWVVNQHVDWGYEVARAWGFEPQQMVTWCKPGLGVGRFQANTEHMLICRRGSRHGNPFGKTSGTWFEWPRGRHSAKPTQALDLVEKCSPGPYVELFARSARLGWDGWGNGYETGPSHDAIDPCPPVSDDGCSDTGTDR